MGFKDIEDDQYRSGCVILDEEDHIKKNLTGKQSHKKSCTRFGKKIIVSYDPVIFKKSFNNIGSVSFGYIYPLYLLSFSHLCINLSLIIVKEDKFLHFQIISFIEQI